MVVLLSLFLWVLLTADTLRLGLSIGPGLSVKNAVLYLLLMVLMFDWVVRRNLPVKRPEVFATFAVVIGYAALTIATIGTFSIYQGYSTKDAIIQLKSGLFDYVVFFAVFLYGTKGSNDSAVVLKALILGVAVTNVLTLMDAAGVGPGVSQMKGWGRMRGVFGDPNETAAVLVCLLPASIAIAAVNRGLLRVAWSLVAASFVAVIITTVSRGAMVAMTVSAVVGTILAWRFISARTLLTGLAIGIGSLAFLAAVTGLRYREEFAERVVGAFQLGVTEASSGRDEIWRSALDRMLASPWSFATGLGWHSYESMPFIAATHNQYLYFWFNLGIIGLLLLPAVFAQFLAASRMALPNSSRETRAYLIAFQYGLVGLATAILFVNLFDVWAYVWAYAGLMMAIVSAPQTAWEPAGAHAPADQGTSDARAARPEPRGTIARTASRHGWSVVRRRRP